MFKNDPIGKNSVFLYIINDFVIKKRIIYEIVGGCKKLFIA